MADDNNQEPNGLETPFPDVDLSAAIKGIMEGDAPEKQEPSNQDANENQNQKDTERKGEPSTQPDPKDEDKEGPDDEAKKEKSVFDLLGDEESKEGKPEETPDEEDELPEDLDEKTKLDWKALKESKRTAIEERETRIKELEKKLEERVADPEVDHIKQENEQMRARLNELDFESSPEFEQNFAKPQQEAVARMEQIATETELDVNIKDMLGLKGKDLAQAVSEAIEGIPEFYRQDFVDAVRGYQKASRERGEALKNAGDYKEKLYAQRRHTQEQAFDQVWSTLGQNQGAILKPMEGEGEDVTAWNEALSKVKAQAKAFATGNVSEKDIALASTKAATHDFFMQQAIPKMKQEYSELVALNRQMAEKLKKLEGQNPKLREKGDKKGEDPLQKKVGTEDFYSEFVKKYS